MLWLATSDTNKSLTLVHSIHSKTQSVMVDLPRAIEAVIALELVAIFLPLGSQSQDTSSQHLYRNRPGENQLQAAIVMAESMHLKDDCDILASRMANGEALSSVEQYQYTALIWTSLMTWTAFNSLDEFHVNHFKIRIGEEMSHHWKRYAQYSLPIIQPGLLCLSHRIDLLYLMQKWFIHLFTLRSKKTYPHFLQDDFIITDLINTKHQLDNSLEEALRGHQEVLLWCRLELGAAISNLIIYFWLGETEDYPTMLQACRDSTDNHLHGKA